jgi:hypothetical protein
VETGKLRVPAVPLVGAGAVGDSKKLTRTSFSALVQQRTKPAPRMHEFLQLTYQLLRQKDDEEKIKHEGVHQDQASGGKKEWESLKSVPLHKSQLLQS